MPAQWVMQLWFLITFLALHGLQVNGYEKSVKFLYKWNVPLDISDDCDKFHLIQSDGMILKVCTRVNKEDRTHVHPFTTYIDSIDKSDEPVSCTIPNLLASDVLDFGNSKLVIQDYHQIIILDKYDCVFKIVQIKANGIILQGSSFHVITKAASQNQSQLLFREQLSVRKYSSEGDFITQFTNFTQQRGELVYQGEHYLMNGTSKYFLIQDVSRYSTRWGIIDIFNHLFEKIGSESIWPYPKAYSAAHNRFSVCYEENGLRCILYDEHFQSKHYVLISYTGSKTLNNYDLVYVHNLLGGGLIVIFCEKISEATCRLYYSVINEQGWLFKNQSFNIESLFTDGALLDPFLMKLDGVFKPKIFELHAEHGIYSLVFPHDGSVHGVAITVRKILKTDKT
ncbi:hypothetical protein QAD02_006655 [Eretmocerus hayati]|uniref:Uncharacterized protein n=1 Tax=Eretmocerus hayati TaxID=131215 RepID=A0ACC2N1X9_9HYME|nr:hypothetical protein QAD02_006655 [Eretmocerus hayati]